MTLVLTTIAVTSSFSDPAAAQPVPLPRVMASAGDSITRAFDADWWCCFLSDGPAESWSSGTDSAVDSHYLRLQRFAPHLGAAYNDSRSGAPMNELASQLVTAATQRADYVTVLMGANDVCTSTVAEMTPVSVFETEFRQALNGFAALRPRAAVFVASIPNVYQLWQLFHTNLYATFIWSTFDICQSMLNTANSESTRQLVVERLNAFNSVLAAVCSEFRQCRWDGAAVHDFSFSPDDVSTIDFFHPSIQGQHDLAAITWAASYWPTGG